MFEKTPEVNYEHEIERVDGRKKLLTLYLNGTEIKQIPFHSTPKIAVRIAISRLFHDADYDVRYTSTDLDSDNQIKGYYIPSKVIRMIIRRQINSTKRKLTRLLNSI